VADVILDLHDGGWMGCMSAYIQYFATHPEVDAKARAIAFVSGMDIIWESPAVFVDDKAPGSVGTASSPLGIPTLTMEMGGEGRVPAEHVERMYRGLDNILRHLGVLPGEPQPHGWPEKLCVRQGNWLRARRGGAYVCLVQPGQRVSKGELLAEVRDAFGETVERIVAPVDGVVIGMRTYGNIATGQYAGNVAEIVPSLD
jgi:predicted deacylase